VLRTWRWIRVHLETLRQYHAAVVTAEALAIERVVGTLKRSYRWTRVRYRGLARNAAHLDLLCLALNLRRVDVLTR